MSVGLLFNLLLSETMSNQACQAQVGQHTAQVSHHCCLMLCRNAVGLCLVIGILMMVCGVSVAVYMQIKITSFLGYKASNNT